MTLKELRRMRGLTQVELAGRMGIAQQTLMRIEQYPLERLKVSTVIRYVEGCGATLRMKAEFPTFFVDLTDQEPSASRAEPAPPAAGAPTAARPGSPVPPA